VVGNIHDPKPVRTLFITVTFVVKLLHRVIEKESKFASYPCSTNPEKQAESEGWIEWFREFLAPGEEPFEPVVDMYYPIIDNVSQIDAAAMQPGTEQNDTVVGLIAFETYWRELLRDNLPEGSNGIIVVVESPCSEQFTYQVFGPEVKYLGIGDLHDVKNNHFMRSGKPADFTTSSIQKEEYAGVPIEEKFCPNMLHIYPSDLLNSEFKTSNGAIFMASMVCIFAFISVVFYLYDRNVERRQKRIALSAQRSLAIVSSLFPSTVRDQLYETQAKREIIATPSLSDNLHQISNSSMNGSMDAQLRSYIWKLQ
jgi:hypothetical protein